MAPPLAPARDDKENEAGQHLYGSVRGCTTGCKGYSEVCARGCDRPWLCEGVPQGHAQGSEVRLEVEGPAGLCEGVPQGHAQGSEVRLEVEGPAGLCEGVPQGHAQGSEVRSEVEGPAVTKAESTRNSSIAPSKSPSATMEYFWSSSVYVRSRASEMA